METAKERRRAQKQVMKEMRPTWSMQHVGEAPFWEIIVFFPYLKKQHKSRDKGYIYRQTFAAILQFYFLFFYFFMYTSFLASQFCVRIQSAAIANSLRKANLQKQEWILPLSILLPKTRFLHRPSSSKKQNISTNNTSNHQQYIHGENHICKEWRPWKNKYRYC